jgi:hypothetical protein
MATATMASAVTGIVVEERPQAKTILDFISQAETNHGFIGLTDYHSDTGRRANYVLQPYGPNGYHRLVEQSLEQLRNGEIEMPETVFGETVDQETWEQAVSEQIASFEKTLDGGHERNQKRVKVDKGFYSIDDTPYVFNVRVVSVHSTPEQKRHNDALGEKVKRIPKSLKAKCKEYIRRAVVLGGYRGQFRLEPSKFKKIAFSHNVIRFLEAGTMVNP